MDERTATGIVPAVLPAVLANPLLAACGLSFRRAADGRSEIAFDVGPFTADLGQGLNGSVLYVMFDAACFLAIASRLQSGAHAVTIDIHVALLRPASVGDTIVVTAEVDRLGRSLANARAQATIRDETGERLLATATVQKAIVAAS